MGIESWVLRWEHILKIFDEYRISLKKKFYIADHILFLTSIDTLLKRTENPATEVWEFKFDKVSLTSHDNLFKVTESNTSLNIVIIIVL